MEMISVSGTSRMCRDCYYREKLTEAILSKSKNKKVKLAEDGMFYEVDDDEDKD